MSNRAALILSGGKAKRFQRQNEAWQDKALIKIKGKTFLENLIQNLQNVVDRIVVCVNTEERAEQYRKITEKCTVKNLAFVVDEKNLSIGGPLKAILSGLRFSSESYFITIPVDMPFVNSKVIDYFFKKTIGFDLSVPMWPDGTLETLLMVLKRERVIEIVETLSILKNSRADSIIRGSAKQLLLSPLGEIESLDPKLESFININTEEDLTRLQTRSTQGNIIGDQVICQENFSLSDLKKLRQGRLALNEERFLEAQEIFSFCSSNFGEKKAHFWEALSWENLGETLLMQSKQKFKEAYTKAAKSYQQEAGIYEKIGCRVLNEVALRDSIRCKSKEK
ncbi:MAG: molybdenum cofactor guanylyltransferase [Candidatus Bathyarchaeota archaeon]|nr:molybdenum cofactor guanylyltransferase [Candidatus Bathyarchaeota archaeon]MDI9578712.1 molybdenum cofactor guanylyltransferase [Thermoproteota archaeon]NLD66264.1 molybdenum cofactor guanylyltransferase [Thermoproteota archaeon]